MSEGESKPKGARKRDRQDAFVREYVKDRNSKQAAIRAGYAPGSAAVQGSRLLTNDKVRAKIDAATLRLEERAEVCAVDVLRELARVAMADVSHAFNADGSLKSIHDMPEDVRRAISGLEIIETAGGDAALKKVKFWSKTDALHKLGLHLRLFNERAETKEVQARVVIALPDNGRTP
jgi:phage terminase small subunit